MTMTDYSSLKTRALQLLGDPDGTRYDDATLQEAFRQALATYTRTCSQVRTEVITFASAGTEQPLDSLECPPLYLLEVNYPHPPSDGTRPAHPGCTLAYIDGSPVLRFADGTSPAAGEQARLTYAARHTLEGLDGAETGSIPIGHEGVIALGAAVFAALQRIHRLGGSIGAPPAEPERLRELAEKYLELFNLELFSLRSVQPVQGFPGGFNLDEWD
jgi:hypothetical protein